MIKYLTLEQVLKIHDSLIEKFGGMQGIRDSNLLVSAVETPKATMSVRIYILVFMTRPQPMCSILFKTIPLMMTINELAFLRDICS